MISSEFMYEQWEYILHFSNYSVAGISKYADSNKLLRGFLFERIP